MKQKEKLLTKAGVLFIAIAMLISALPIVMADSGNTSSGITAPIFELAGPSMYNPETQKQPRLTPFALPYIGNNPSFGGGLGADAWIGYNDGYTENSLGLTSGGIITMAIELTETEIGLYRDYDICELYVSVGSDANAPGDVVGYTVWIETSLPADPYSGGLNIVATGTSTDAVWQIIDVTDTAIPDTGSVFVGINFNTVAGQYPCGIDESASGPARGALLTYDGLGSWSDLFAIGFPGVWGLDVGVCEGGGPGPGPVEDCLPDQCDFEIVALNQLYMYDGKINELPKIINITITNNGEIPISELKLLADVYKKICGPTTPLGCSEKYDLRFWETEAAADWDWIDDGDDDTWVLQGGEDNRWYTNNQAWRCTAGEDRSYGGDTDTYLGLADNAVGYDELIYTPADPAKNDISGAVCSTVTFWHWCEGEYTFDDDGNVVPIDYGTVSYSLDNGATWTELDFSDFVAYDTNGEWELVTLKFMNTNIYDGYAEICSDCEPQDGDIVIYEAFPDFANLQLKFTWQKDPCDQYEGWYIDEICIERTETYYLELVHQTHEILALDGCDPEVGPVHQYFEFPLGWDPEPETWYRIEICGQVFSPAGCEINIDNNCIYTQFFVTDIHDIICKEMNIITPGPYRSGDSISVNMTVKNIGTFAESDIPVVLKQSKAVVQNAVDDTFETDPATRWKYYYFGGFQPESLFRWTKGDPSIDMIYDIDAASARSVLPGSESLIGAKQGFYPYVPEDYGFLMTDDKVYDFGSKISATLDFYAKYSFDVDGGSCLLVHPTSGPDSDSWWIIDFGGWRTTDYANDWVFVSADMKALAESFAYDGITPKVEFGFGVIDLAYAFGYDGTTANPFNPIPWSGLMLDNINLKLVSCGTETVVDSKTIPGTLAPGQEATVMMTWNNAEFCAHCLIGDVNLPGDVNPDNDICVDTVFVNNYIDLNGFTSLDLTGDGDCLWHLCDTRGGGDDTYAWAGIVEGNWGHYVNNMDDSFISPMINISKLASSPFIGGSLNFTTWYEFNDAGDFGEIYIRASPSDNWVKLDKITGSSGGFFTDVGYYIDPVFCTETFQIRFRMVSDASGVSEGWYIDDVCIIEIMEGTVGAPSAPGDVIFHQEVIPSSGSWSFINIDESLGYGAYENFQITADVPIGSVSIVGLPMVYSGGWVPYPPENAVFHIQLYDGPYGGTTIPPTGLLLDTSINTFDSIVAKESYSGFQAYEWTFTLPSNVVVTGQDGWLYVGGQILWGNSFDGDSDSYHVSVGWTGDDRAMTLYEGGLPFVPVYGDPVWCDDFERDIIAPWICQATIAGDYWEHQDGVTKTYLPDTVTEPYDDVDGWWVIHGYPGVGKGLNDVLYGKLDLTELGGDEFTDVELFFAFAWNVEPGCEMFVEISPDYAGGDMNAATWIPYWYYPTSGVTGPSDWITSKELVNDDRFVLNQYIGEEIYVRFRFTTPGEGVFSPVAGHGWAVDGIGLMYKTFTFTDTEPPVTSISFNEATRQVTLIAVDMPLNKGTGVKATYYTVDGGSTTTYTSPFTLSEGSHTVQYWSEDNAGNVESKKSATYVVDTTPPTVTLTKPEAGKLYLFGSPIMNRIFGSTTLCIGKVPVAASASDGTGTGVNMVMFEFSNGDTGFDNVGSDGWTYTFRGMHFGSLTITARAVDGKGLVSSPASMTITVYSLGLL